MGFRTMYAVLEETAKTFGNAPALHQPTGKDQYRRYSWIEYKRAAEEIACGLRLLGIGKGDTVALRNARRILSCRSGRSRERLHRRGVVHYISNHRSSQQCQS